MLSPVEHFIDTAAASGLVLIAVAALAFVWANSPWAPAYQAMLHAPAGIELGSFALKKPLELWVNDLLMAVFFFLVGLEIKRELLIGELAGWKRASLPAVGAIGGMVAPALIYAAINAGTPYAPGWGIPMATDIAFAVGVLALLGDRVPPALKLFLLALAIVDDLGAVIVIALFYTEQLDFGMLGLALGVWILALLYGRLKGGGPVVYLILGAIMWYAMLKSGVHATIAGVLLALAVPLARRMDPETVKQELKRQVGGRFEEVEVTLDHLEGVLSRAQSPLHSFEHALAPWVAFLIMPVFALFNAGVPLAQVDPSAILGGATAGVFLGLLVGKPLGIVGLVWLAEKAGITERSPGMTWPALTGIGLLAGIGFTMALFIAALAFGPTPELDQAKIGVLAASVVAAIAGLLVLRTALARS
ncbi:MAG: Na+/H+ antiporter NhaA [Geminicoccaceae bacterium]